jgi:hopene-associated glycosyltransferase HpnB
MNHIILILTILSLLIWLYLLIFRGRFWLADQKIELPSITLNNYPSICAIIPARNEADVLSISLASLLKQNYLGDFSLILVDDQSIDDTGHIAEEIAQKLQKNQHLTVIYGQPLPVGWTGKLWAIEQGIIAANQRQNPPDYFLFTDADIQHDLNNVQELAIKAEQENLALTSLMVLLRCESFWEKLLIPAFVFFFQKLYPFPWVNHPQNKMAAAAGGCILIRREILEKIGGIAILKQALIDDCSLAAAVKSYLQTNPNSLSTSANNTKQSASIWLGLTNKTVSLRAYHSLKSLWDLVARTAFTQLNYSVLLLLGTVLSMILIYLIAPFSIILGISLNNGLIVILAGLIWVLMIIAYIPTLKLYKLSPLWALTLPAIAFLYTLMTIDSAWRYWRGRGGGWKGRVYRIN